jgi:biotin operon repressor
LGEWATAEKRRCEACGRTFRSIRVRRIHEHAAHGIPLPEPAPAERPGAVLAVIAALTERVAVGPQAAEIAARLHLKPRAVNKRLLRLRSQGYVATDDRGGYLLSTKGRAALRAAGKAQTA